MSNLTSTLTILLKDDGLAAKAKADAEALKRLGMSGKDLAKLGAANPHIGKLTKQLEGLQAQAGRVGAFREAGNGLKALHGNLRAARGEVERTAAVLKRRQDTLDYFAGVKKADPRRYAKWVSDGLTAKVQQNFKDARKAASAAGREAAAAEGAYAKQLGTYRGLRTQLVGADGSIGKLAGAQGTLTAKIEATNAALQREISLLGQAEAKAQAQAQGAASRAQANRRAAAGLAPGMASPDHEYGRRLTDGMSAPARRSRAASAADAEQARLAAEERAAQQRDARKTLLGLGGIYLGHKAHQATEATLHTYREFDKERRFGKAVMGISDEEQKPLIDQAIHLGATTKFNDVQVLEAQRELAARGLKKDQLMGMMGSAADLGQSFDLQLPQSVRQMEGAIFGFQKPIGTLADALASAKQTADVQVKAAKISGMTPEDITQTYKYGATPARMAGLSEHSLLAFAGISKKANMGGDEAGVAFRALVANMMSPTRKAKEAMLANGMDYNRYQKKPDSIDSDAFFRNVQSSYGVKLSKTAQEAIRGIFTNKDMIGDSAKFTPEVMKVLGQTLGKKDAKSKASIAGMANRFRDASMKGVDSDRLMADLMEAIPKNPALANAIFGSKQGARIANALGNPEAFKHMLGELIHGSDGYAAKISKERMAGYDGAMSRLEGATKNLESRAGASWDNEGRGGFLTGLTNAAARATQALAELPQPVLALGSAVGWAGGKAASAAGTLSLVGAAVSLKGSAAALTAAAARLGLAGSVPGVPGAAVAPGGTKGPPSKGGKVLRAAKTLGGLTIVGGLGTVAQDFNILPMPKAEDGWGKGALKFLDPRLADMVYGDGSSAVAPNTPAAKRGQEFGNLKRVPLPPRRPVAFGGTASPAADPVGDLGRSSVPDAGAIQQATQALATYKAELAGIKSELAGQAGLDLPGIGTGLEARKAELEGLISGLESKLQGLGSTTIAPHVDGSSLDAVKPAANEAKAALDGLNTSVRPNVDSSSIAAANAQVDALLAKLRQLGAEAAALPGKIAAAGAAAGAAQASLKPRTGGSSPSFADGATPGNSTG